jgi:hypothetical protein
VSADRATRRDWIVGGLALLLVIDLLELPWHTVGGGTISGISLPSISNPGTGPPAAFLGVLAVLASLAVLFDLVFERLSPQTNVPSIGGNRSLTRYALAIAAAVLMALKFVLHLTQIGNLGVGFWFAAVLVAALVYATMQAKRDEPAPRASAEESARAGENSEPAGATEEPEHATSTGESQRAEARETSESES